MGFDNKLFTEAFRFVIVGVINTGIDFLVFFTLVWGFDFHIVPANVLSFTVAVINSFVMNKYWSFRHRQSRVSSKMQFPLFVGVNGVGMVLSTLTVWGLAQFVPVAAAKVCAAFVSFIWNFFGSRNLVYRAETPG